MNIVVVKRKEGEEVGKPNLKIWRDGLVTEFFQKKPQDWSVNGIHII